MDDPRTPFGARAKERLMRLKGTAPPYLEEDEDDQMRVVPNRAMPRDATRVREPSLPRDFRDAQRIHSVLPANFAAPPSRNVEDRRRRRGGVGAALRKIVS